MAPTPNAPARALHGHRVAAWVRAAIALLAALLLGGTFAQAAQAGTYDVWSCKTASGIPTSTTGWTASSSLLYDQPTDDCALGGRLAAKFTATGGGVSGGLAARWLFTAPEGTTIQSATLDRALVARSATGDHQGVARAAIYRGGFVDDAGHRVEACDAGGEPCGKGSAKLKIGADSFGISAGCVGPSGDSLCVRGTGSRAGVSIDSARITLQDDHAPVAKVSGAVLTPARPLRGAESIRLKATDVGAGVWQAEVRLGATVVMARRTIDRNGGRCQTLAGTRSFGDPVPCDTRVSTTLPFSAKGVKDGSQLLTVTVWDAANNPTVAVSTAVIVDNAHRVQDDGTILMPAISGDSLDDPLAGGSTGGEGTVPTGPLRPTSTPEDPQLQRIVSAMNTLADAQIPYCYGGGHQTTPAVPSAGSYCWIGSPAKKYRNSGAVGLDCSSSVSWVLQQTGYGIATMTSGEMTRLGDPGPGKYLTIWANAGHVYLEVVIGGTHYYWGTSAYNVEHGPGWHPARSGAGFTARHIPGL